MKFSIKNIVLLLLRIVAALILLQTLYFKFTGKPESVAIFTKLGVEPWGRIATGVMELITGVLLLVPSAVFFGACIGVGLMTGAILSHLFVIGISSDGDGGQLFFLAVTVWVFCAILLVFYKNQGAALLARFRKSKTTFQ